MRRLLPSAILTAACVFLAGCIYGGQNTQKITLNPDGSGKCELRLTLDVARSSWMNAMPDGKGIVELILKEGVQGVDAWSDVSYKVTPEKRLEFAGTCYFKNLQDFHVNPMVGGGGLIMRMEDMREARSGLALMMNSYRPRFGSPAMGAPLPPEAADKRITALRPHWNELKTGLSRGLAGSEGNAKIDITYLLPGNIKEVTGFTVVPGGVRLTGDLKQLLPAVDKLMADDQAMRNAVANEHFPGDGDASLPDQVLLAMTVLGKPLYAKMEGELEPLFDYVKEAAAAHSGQRQMFEKLGLPDLSKLTRTFTDGDSGLTAGLDSDGRTIVVRDPSGKNVWIRDVIKEAGGPAMGDPVVRDLSVSMGKVQAVYGKNTVASFDLKTGKFLGSRSE